MELLKALRGEHSASIGEEWLMFDERIIRTKEGTRDKEEFISKKNAS
jgi:hypothetical protein